MFRSEVCYVCPRGPMVPLKWHQVVQIQKEITAIARYLYSCHKNHMLYMSLLLFQPIYLPRFRTVFCWSTEITQDIHWTFSTMNYQWQIILSFRDGGWWIAICSSTKMRRSQTRHENALDSISQMLWIYFHVGWSVDMTCAIQPPLLMGFRAHFNHFLQEPKQDTYINICEWLYHFKEDNINENGWYWYEKTGGLKQTTNFVEQLKHEDMNMCGVLLITFY